MKDARRNTWNPTGTDNFFSGGIIAVGIIGLLLAQIVGPMPDAAAPATAGMVISEAAA